jgi:hypothetical protein
MRRGTVAEAGRASTGRRRAAFGAACFQTVWGGSGTAGPRPVLRCFLPFRRDRLSRAIVFHAPSGWRPSHSGLAGSPPTALRLPTRGGHDGLRTSAVRVPAARGEQAEAIHRPPRGPPESPSPGLHRSTTARRHRERGSDALPVRRDGQEYGPAASYGGKIGSRICDVAVYGGYFPLNPTIIPRIVSTASRAFPPAIVILRRGEAETGGPSGAEGDLFRQAVANGGAPDRVALSRAPGSSGLRR